MERGVVTDDCDWRGRVMVGLKVYDVDGDLVGTVETVDQTAGLMRVATNPFLEQPLVVPLDLIVSVNARELFLSAARRTLTEARGGEIEQPA